MGAIPSSSSMPATLPNGPSAWPNGEVTGAFNACGPATALTMQQMLAGIAEGVHADPKIAWAPHAFPEGRTRVSAWGDMPGVVSRRGQYPGLSPPRHSPRPLAEGLTYRPLAAHGRRHTLAWFSHPASGNVQAKLRAGLRPEREAELLAKLKA